MTLQSISHLKNNSNHATIALFLLLVLISTQNIIAMIFAGNGIPGTQLIYVGKEVYVGLTLFIFAMEMLYKGRLERGVLVPGLMLIYLVLIAGIASPYFNLFSFRQAIVIPVFILFGLRFQKNVNYALLTNLLLYTFLVIVILALFERLVLYNEEETFFNWLGVKEWNQMKGWGYRVPRSWYSYDLTPWTGVAIRRVPGLLIGDAVNFGAAMAFPLVLFVVSKKWFGAFLTSVCIIIGMSKTGFVAGIIGIFLYYTLEHLSRRQRLFVWSISLAMFVFIIMISLEYLMQVGSILVHFRGASTNLLDILSNPLGNGIGSGGNFAGRFGVAGASADGFGLNTGVVDAAESLAFGESFLGTMIAQFGFFGLWGYLYYPIKLMRTHIPTDQTLLMAVKYSSIGIFATGLFAESSIGWIATGFLFALVPLCLGYNQRVQDNDAPLTQSIELS